MNQLGELLWQNNTASGRIIILLILGAGLSGCMCALAHCLRYRRTERKWLDVVRSRLRRAQESRQLAPEPAAHQHADTPASAPLPASPLIELTELTEGISATTLIGDRLRTIVRMKQARAKVNVQALQQSSVLKENAVWTISFPGYVVSLAMMLGLLGTFIGLAVMVVDIQKALPAAHAGADAAEWTSSVSSLGGILAGKKTAFSATLVGLFCSIVVSALNFALARAQSEFYDRLERFTAEELLPATVPAFDDETPWEKLSAQLGDSFEHLKALADEQTRSAERIMGIEKTFATVLDNIEAITRRAATTPLQGMAGEISNVIGALTQVNTAMIGLTERLPQVLNAFRQSHQTTLREITTAMQTQQTTLDRVSQAIASRNGGLFGRLSFAAAGAAAILLVVILVTRLA